jgi:hypothetical protein
MQDLAKPGTCEDEEADRCHGINIEARKPWALGYVFCRRFGLIDRPRQPDGLCAPQHVPQPGEFID